MTTAIVSGRKVLKFSEEKFVKRLQTIVDHFNKSGAKVFVVSENPVLYADIRSLIKMQPFRPAQQRKPVYSADVRQHQEKYLNALKRVKGATIIDSMSAFCPGETCLITDKTVCHSTQMMTTFPSGLEAASSSNTSSNPT